MDGWPYHIYDHIRSYFWMFEVFESIPSTHVYPWFPNKKWHFTDWKHMFGLSENRLCLNPHRINFSFLIECIFPESVWAQGSSNSGGL